MQKAEKKFLENIDLSNIPQNYMETFARTEKLYMTYNCAIPEIKTKLENLDQEMEFVKERNPIRHITSRLKKQDDVFSLTDIFWNAFLCRSCSKVSISSLLAGVFRVVSIWAASFLFIRVNETKAGCKRKEAIISSVFR